MIFLSGNSHDGAVSTWCRWEVAAQLRDEWHPALTAAGLDLLFLDNTYCNPRCRPSRRHRRQQPPYEPRLLSWPGLWSSPRRPDLAACGPNAPQQLSFSTLVHAEQEVAGMMTDLQTDVRSSIATNALQIGAKTEAGWVGAWADSRRRPGRRRQQR